MGKPKKTSKNASIAKKSKSKKSKKSKNSKEVPKPELETNESPPISSIQKGQGEFICIHIGQAGVQVGSVCWELFCLEHGINPDGTVHQLTTNSTSIFSLSNVEKYVPRALLVDTEPSIIDEIKKGKYQNLFSSQSMICGKENAASNYAAGFYGVGKKILPEVMDQLARLAEGCDSLQGIALFRSIGGGTGSGMGSRIIETIKNTYPGKTITDFNIYSTLKQSPVIVEPYNITLATHHVLDTVNCSFLFNNKSLYDICSSKLNFTQITYKDINNIIALVSSGITSSLRFEGSMISNFSEMIASLIPQPRLHFPLITHVPITNNSDNISYACTELAKMSFDHNYQMNNINPRLGKYLSICMMFRGELTPTNINTTIAFIQRENTIPVTQNMNSPLFKFGLCYQPPVTVPCSEIISTDKKVTTLCNNTAVKHCWINIKENYNKLLRKKAFLHHYIGEGMEEGMFDTTNESISKLIAEYEEIENC